MTPWNNFDGLKLNPTQPELFAFFKNNTAEDNERYLGCFGSPSRNGSRCESIAAKYWPATRKTDRCDNKEHTIMLTPWYYSDCENCNGYAAFFKNYTCDGNGHYGEKILHCSNFPEKDSSCKLISESCNGDGENKANCLWSGK